MKRKSIALAGSAALMAALLSGCQNAGVAHPPVVQSPPADAHLPTGSVQPIATSEPDSYSATLLLTAEILGGHHAALPRLEADVARRGRDRRISFRLPDGGEVVYLSRHGTRYVILPDRRKYAEVTSHEAGFELPRLLTPDQLVDYLQQQRGYARTGELELNGRTVVKYVAAGEARTGTQAGDAAAENVVYVDKMTELPLRAELISQAEGDVRGVRGVKVVTEMRHVRTGVEQDLFAVPRGMQRVEAEQVRQQVNTLVSTAVGIVGSLLNRTGTAANAPTSAAR